MSVLALSLVLADDHDWQNWKEKDCRKVMDKLTDEETRVITGPGSFGSGDVNVTATALTPTYMAAWSRLVMHEERLTADEADAAHQRRVTSLVDSGVSGTSLAVLLTPYRSYSKGRYQGSEKIPDTLTKYVRGFIQEPKHDPKAFIKPTTIEDLGEGKLLLIFDDWLALAEKNKRLWCEFHMTDEYKGKTARFIAQWKTVDLLKKTPK